MSPVITIFRNRLRSESFDEYQATLSQMVALARSMPGFVESKTFVSDDGERATLVTFTDPQSQQAWAEHPEHRAAQQAGRDLFYAEYHLLVGEVTYESHFPT